MSHQLRLPAGGVKAWRGGAPRGYLGQAGVEPPALPGQPPGSPACLPALACLPATSVGPHLSYSPSLGLGTKGLCSPDLPPASLQCGVPSMRGGDGADLRVREQRDHSWEERVDMTAQPTPGLGQRWGPGRGPVPPAALRSWPLWKMGCVERWGHEGLAATESLGTWQPVPHQPACLPR